MSDAKDLALHCGAPWTSWTSPAAPLIVGVMVGHSALGGLDDLGELGTGPYTLWSHWSQCSRRCRLFRVCGIATSKVGRGTVRYV